MSYKGTTGYILIYLPTHPHAMRNGCVYEHRLVMEHYLQRSLLTWEAVHHKDGNRSNNDITNLVLTTKGENTRIANKLRGSGRYMQSFRWRRLSILQIE